MRKSLRILLAEDDPASQELIRSILEDAGHRVMVAGSGIETITLLNRNLFDCVVMNVEMPELDGIETTTLIRAAKSASFDTRIPVIAMSVNTTEDARDRCIRAGMNAFLPRPFSVQKLLSLLDAVILRYGETAVKREEGASAGEIQETPVIDIGNTYRRLGNDEAIIRLIWRAFARETTALVERLGEALDRGDPALAERTAHSIKGVSANIDAPMLRDVASRMECLSRAGETERARDLIGELRMEFDRVMKYLESKGVTLS